MFQLCSKLESNCCCLTRCVLTNHYFKSYFKIGTLPVKLEQSVLYSEVAQTQNVLHTPIFKKLIVS